MNRLDDQKTDIKPHNFLFQSGGIFRTNPAASAKLWENYS